MHVRRFPDELKTATKDCSEGLVPDSSESRSGSAVRLFSLTKAKRRVRVMLVVPHRLLSLTAGERRRNSDESAAVAPRSIRFIDKDSAEHVTTILWMRARVEG